MLLPIPMGEPTRRVSNDSAAPLAAAKADDRMAIMAALAMTELVGGGSSRPGGAVGPLTDENSRKRKVSEGDTSEQQPKKKNPSPTAVEDIEVRAVVSANPTMSPPHSRDNSPVGVVMPPPPPPQQFCSYSFSGNSKTPYNEAVAMTVPPPKVGTRVSPTYEETTRNSGLPKSLSFRKICSKCGKTRGEHGELGFGNKCVYQECGRCGAGLHMHVKNNISMGILCTLSEEQGAVPGASEAYERKIRDLAFRAECQKGLQQQRAAAANPPVIA